MADRLAAAGRRHEVARHRARPRSIAAATISRPTPRKRRERADAAAKAVAELRASVQDMAKNSAAGSYRRQNSMPCKSASRRLNNPPSPRVTTSPRPRLPIFAARLALSAAALARRGHERRAVCRRTCAGQSARCRRERYWRRLRRSPHPACRARKRWRRNCVRCLPAMLKVSGAQAPRRLPRTIGGQCRQTGAHPSRSMRRRATMRPRFWRASRSMPPRPTFAAALADLGKLNDATRAPAQAWIAKAQARQAALAARAPICRRHGARARSESQGTP